MSTNDEFEEYIHGEHPGDPTIKLLESELLRDRKMRETPNLPKGEKQYTSLTYSQEGTKVKAKIRLSFLGDVAILVSLPLGLLASLGTLIANHRKNNPPSPPS